MIMISNADNQALNHWQYAAHDALPLKPGGQVKGSSRVIATPSTTSWSVVMGQCGLHKETHGVSQPLP